VLIGESRRRGPTWVHDHESPASRLQLPDPPREPGDRHHRALRDRRVATEDQHEASAIQIGYRHQELVPVHPGGHEQVREHVHGDGRVDVAASQRGDKILLEEHQLVVVGGRVAPVQRDGVGAVRLPNRSQAARRQLDGVGPRDRLPAGLGAPKRSEQPVGVVVQVGEGNALRADRSSTQRVVRVPPNSSDAVVLDGHAQTAAGLAEGTGPVNDARDGRSPGLSAGPPADHRSRRAPPAGSLHE
jgi:hypothetical protein